MKPSDVGVWITIAAAILAAGMWLGSLNTRVTTLEKTQDYLHGPIQVPAKH